ncbi:aldose epimerase family protein [Poritiphilus flavus]|uniref:Aldose 1-epimerase n=1 Tax=Poritiphilus flavus TaxID=2697053 RepID=A0A6L9EAI8_9FLAO|nr:aldose epimerase family protein [Poritiphilus flavus]NAS11551.1 galactose-1-epimerase [Poritiphilus flavus]
MKNKIRPKLVLLMIILIIISSCKEKRSDNQIPADLASVSTDTTLSGLQATHFTDTINSKPVGLYVLKNKNGLEATFTNYGQRLISLLVPDKNGRFEDVVLGFSSLEPYTVGRGMFFGAVVGRYGNRIANGSFELDGVNFDLARNNGPNHLHGGEIGFEAVVWEVDSLTDNHIRFRRLSPDMEEGYPGNLEVVVRYTLTDANELEISYEAETDKKTHVNLTHHSYFNLKGAGNGDITDHILYVNADHFTPVAGKGLIPTGELRPVKGTPFDFLEPKLIGKEIDSDYEQMQFGGGYDHNFVLNDSPTNASGLVLAARVTEPKSGRVMEVYTNEPGVQLYCGNFMDGKTVGKKEKIYAHRGALCLETQHFPNSPNQQNFPSTILEPGEQYNSVCVYQFKTTE